jgi:dipeptidyl aminopeptidase/acylaminoacyl peptidase
VAVIISVSAWIMYVPVVVRVFGETPFLFADTSQPLAEGEECEFPTSDGLTLRGTYLATHAEQRQGVIAFCHEMTSDRSSCTQYVKDLLHRGYDVFAFDFRNHGQSDRMPGYEPIPWLTRYELEDVLAAVDYLCGRDDADPQGIGLLGISRGGTAALCAAACDGRIRAVATDGAFPLEEMQLHYMRRYMEIYLRYSWLLSKLPDVSLSSFCRWGRYFVGLRRRCQFINVTQFTRKIRQPVFLIHGERDNYVPLEVVHLLRSSISRRTRLWVVPGAKHNRAIHVAMQQYHRRIGRFFSNHLSAEPAVAALEQLNRAAG